MIKVGIIGVGHMGEIHLKKLKLLNHIYNIIGIYDADVMQAKEVAKKYNVKIYNNLEELLDKIEAVIIATPSQTHYEISSRCIYKNVNVLVEKPMTVNSKSSNELLGKYNSLKEKPLFQVGFVERFNPVIKILAEIVKEENIQNIFFYRKTSNSKIKDTDVVFDLMIHDLDLSMYLLHEERELRKVSGLKNKKIKMLEHINVLYVTRSGAHINIIASKVSGESERKIYINTREEYIEADLINKKINIVNSYGERREIICDSEGPNRDAIASELIEFSNSILNNREPRCNIDDGYNATILAEQIVKKFKEQSGDMSR